MDRLTAILKQVIEGYTGEALNGYSYLTASADERLFTVVSVGHVHGERFADTALIVRVMGKHIVIERDVNDKLLVDALLQAGISRDKIVLAYAGEPVQETVA